MDDDYALAVELQMQEEREYQAMLRKSQQSTKCQ